MDALNLSLEFLNHFNSIFLPEKEEIPPGNTIRIDEDNKHLLNNKNNRISFTFGHYLNLASLNVFYFLDF